MLCNCENCGKPFERKAKQRGTPQKFCNPACRRRWDAKARARYRETLGFFMLLRVFSPEEFTTKARALSERWSKEDGRGIVATLVLPK